MKVVAVLSCILAGALARPQLPAGIDPAVCPPGLYPFCDPNTLAPARTAADLLPGSGQPRGSASNLLPATASLLPAGGHPAGSALNLLPAGGLCGPAGTGCVGGR